MNTFYFFIYFYPIMAEPVTEMPHIPCGLPKSLSDSNAKRIISESVTCYVPHDSRIISKFEFYNERRKTLGKYYFIWSIKESKLRDEPNIIQVDIYSGYLPSNCLFLMKAGPKFSMNELTPDKVREIENHLESIVIIHMNGFKKD